MNEQLFLSPLSFLFRRFNDSMCLFAFFFLFKGFSVLWLDICYSRLTWFLMASNVSRLQEHDMVHGEQPSDAS